MWSRFTLMRSFGISVAHLTRGYFSINSLNCDKLSMAIPGKTPSSSKNFSKILNKTALTLFLSGAYTLVHSISESPVSCQEFKMEDITEDTLNTENMKPLEMNEVAALTHTSLLRQASGVAVDAAHQLLNRSVRATLDCSSQYRKQLHELINLLEFCTTTIRNQDQHDSMWHLLVAARSHTDSLKQQLKDLAILVNYAYVMVENAGMAAYISGTEFTASTAQQAVTNAKCELEKDARQNYALDVQYMYAHTRYIEASQRLAEEKEKIKNSSSQEKEEEEEEGHGASTC